VPGRIGSQSAAGAASALAVSNDSSVLDEAASIEVSPPAAVGLVASGDVVVDELTAKSTAGSPLKTTRKRPRSQATRKRGRSVRDRYSSMDVAFVGLSFAVGYCLAPVPLPKTCFRDGVVSSISLDHEPVRSLWQSYESS
jgi:hypothetical protein